MNSKLKLGDLVRVHSEFRYTPPIEGNQYKATGVGLVVDIKEKRTSPVTINKEVTVLWSNSGERTINVITSLVKITGKDL